MIGVVAVLLAAGIVVAILLGTRSGPPRANENTGAAVGAATVQRRDLVQTDTESGTLSYADPQAVYDRLSGTITWLPRVGQLIKRGQALFEVDEMPVTLLYGSRPAYRDLGPSDGSGADIRELNANLVSLGYSAYGIVVDDSWQTATTNAVKALQKSLGEKQTGKIALGRVVFLPGEQLINAIDGTVGSPASPANPSPGPGGGAGILQTSSARLVVGVDLAAAAQSEAVVGSRVTVELPNGAKVAGTIAAVSPIARISGSGGANTAGGSSGSGAGGSGSSATVPVTITLDRHVKGAGLDRAPVSVDFAHSKAKHVLSVPVTALVATSGARFAVQEASAPHRLIQVSTGLFAAGYVQISGPGIHPGLRVTDSQG